MPDDPPESGARASAQREQPAQLPPRRPRAVWHEGEWYVSASSLSASTRKLVLKDNDAFVVSDRRGDFPSTMPGEFGYYYHGTRFLSRMEVRVHDDLPLVLDADLGSDESRIEIELTNEEVWSEGPRRVPPNTLHIRRELVLQDDVLYQRLLLHNFDLEPMDVELSITCESDYADIFEVRGFVRDQRGSKLPTRATNDKVVLSYQGLDGCTRRTEITVTPSSDGWVDDRFLFQIRLGPREDRELCVCVQPIEEPARPDGGPQVIVGDACESRDGRSGSRAERLARMPRFETNDSRLNRVLDRAMRDMVTMLSDTPAGVYPFAGVPWYCAPFGRDGSITALELLPWMPEVARGVLTYQAAHQAHDFDDFTDREPGKIFHEFRTGEMAALREIPFIPYYGSSDSTPLFLILLAAYAHVTDDLELVDWLWPNALAAFEWIERYGDLDGDGFVEYHARSPVGLRNQAWKDSVDSVSHEDGTLAEPPITACEVQAYVIRAYRSMADLAERRGDPALAASWRERADRLQKQLHARFWLDERDTYAIALDRDKRPCRIVTTNAGHVLWAGAADPEPGRRAARRLTGPDLFTGFGLRTLESGARRYSPLSYHNGSVWPHDNALVAEGMRRYGHMRGVFDVFSGIVDAIDQTPDGRVPELFCGFARTAHHKPVPYPVACAPQAWASAAIVQFVTTLLGLDVDARANTVLFDDPLLPEWLQWIEVQSLPVPGGSMHFSAVRARASCSIEIVSKPPTLNVLVRKQHTAIGADVERSGR